MSARYDQLGYGYRAVRQPDPRIAARIERALGGARSIINVGAGTGSYEPTDREVTAVEPSELMISQRRPGSAPVIRARAEQLPFGDDSFDAALAVLTLHHWADLDAGLAEMRRVASERLVVVTFDPEVLWHLWIVRDYFPAMVRSQSDPTSSSRIAARLPASREVALPVPWDCSDHFFAALWARPELFFEANVLKPMWVWQRLSERDRKQGQARLAGDLKNGRWSQRYGHLLKSKELDVGLRLVISELP